MTLHSLPSKLSALAAAFALACGAAPQPTSQPFEATLRVVSDDGQPLGGAQLALGKQALGTTSSAGTLTVRLRGSEGQALKLSLDCPDGYAAPPTLPPLRLTRTRRVGQQGAQPLSFEATCTRETRSVALVVHAANGSGLPLLVNGTPQTSTDPDGNAHVLLELARHVRNLSVKLDTEHHPELKPANPERTFELSGRDAVLLFEPALTKIAPKRRAVRSARAVAAPPPRHIPYRVE